MILRATFVEKPRRARRCDDCGKWLDHHIYLYGGIDMYDKPQGYRSHWEHVTRDPDPKVQAAVAVARAYEAQKAEAANDE